MENGYIKMGSQIGNKSDSRNSKRLYAVNSFKVKKFDELTKKK